MARGAAGVYRDRMTSTRGVLAAALRAFRSPRAWRATFPGLVRPWRAPATWRQLGYLLKDRVAHVSDFLDALRRVAAGGTALDPEVVAQLLVRRRSDPLDRLTPRELEVLRLMAEGRSNNGIATTLRISHSAVEKYVSNIFTKLDLPPTDTDHRRVLAVLKVLRA